MTSKVKLSCTLKHTIQYDNKDLLTRKVRFIDDYLNLVRIIDPLIIRVNGGY